MKVIFSNYTSIHIRFNFSLVKHNNQSLLYDNYNRMIYFGIDDNNCKRFEWDNNKMIKCNKGNEIITFKYDTRGSRTNKTITKDNNIISINYILDNNKLIKEERSNGISLIYLYSDNDIIGFVYNNEYYIYHKNITGEIIAILKNHQVVARYVYDAWGKHTVYNGDGTINTNASFIGNINPIRYKGYYYDGETELFYCGSRYYSPELGRFIQPADISSLSPQSINGLNLYSYANNNPIGIAYCSSGVGFGTGGGMVNSLALGGSLGGGTIGGDSSSWFTTLPAVPNALKDISKANDVFSAFSHSFMIGKYLFGNGRLHTLSYLDDMIMLGVNPAKGLSSLPKASWLNKLGYVFSAIDGIVTIYDNLQQGNSWGQALLDGALSFGKSAASAWVGGFVGANVGGMIGVALGLIIPIPGVGAFIGFVAGTGVGIVVSWFVDEGLRLLKDGLLELIFD